MAHPVTRLATVAALLLVAHPADGLAGGHPFGAAAIDDNGTVYQLAASGAVTVGAEERPIIPIRDAAMQAMDISVVKQHVVISGLDANTRQAQLEVYTLDGTPVRTVFLADRFFPQRVLPYRGQIAVLGSTPEEGIFVEVLDQNYRVRPDARIYTPVACGDLGLADIAATRDGLWVASLERCRGGYLVQKYDADGSIVAEFEKTLAGEKTVSGPEITPVIIGIFSTADFVGVVLNQEATVEGKPVDLWTSAGEFLERVRLPTVPGGLVQVLSRPTRQNDVTLVELESGVTKTIDLARVVAGAR